MNTITNIKPLLILSLVLLLGSNQNIAQNVGIGSESFTPDPSAMLEVKATDKGMLVPRVDIEDLSTAAPVTNPAVSLLVYNTNETTGAGFYYWDGSSWVSIGGTGGLPCTTPLAPTEGTHIVKEYKITWNWIPSTDDPTFFRYNIVNDYSSATSTAGNNSLTIENLNCEQTYTIYVWAYNACGNSTSLTLTQTTSACPFVCGTSTVTFNYNGSPVTYGTVTSQGRCWLDRNLGATQVASNSTDAASYGDLFQWGRRDDGHQTRTSGTTTSLSNTDQPAHGNFITNSNSPNDWRSDNNNNRWNANPIVNNPCPSGWRVPTEAEWVAERLSWTPNNNTTGALSSPLKLPLTGRRSNSNGSLIEVGSTGNYWSSSVVGANSRMLHFHSGYADMINFTRALGCSVRCIKD